METNANQIAKPGATAILTYAEIKKQMQQGDLKIVGAILNIRPAYASRILRDKSYSMHPTVVTTLSTVIQNRLELVNKHHKQLNLF